MRTIKIPISVELTFHLLQFHVDLLKSVSEKNTNLVYKAFMLELCRSLNHISDLNQNAKQKLSFSTILSNLRFEESDILSEIRHSIIHKTLPPKIILDKVKDYMVKFLYVNYWRKHLKNINFEDLLQEFTAFKINMSKIFHGVDPHPAQFIEKLIKKLSPKDFPEKIVPVEQASKTNQFDLFLNEDVNNLIHSYPRKIKEKIEYWTLLLNSVIHVFFESNDKKEKDSQEIFYKKITKLIKVILKYELKHLNFAEVWSNLQLRKCIFRLHTIHNYNEYLEACYLCLLNTKQVQDIINESSFIKKYEAKVKENNANVSEKKISDHLENTLYLKKRSPLAFDFYNQLINTN